MMSSSYQPGDVQHGNVDAVELVLVEGLAPVAVGRGVGDPLLPDAGVLPAELLVDRPQGEVPEDLPAS